MKLNPTPGSPTPSPLPSRDWEKYRYLHRLRWSFAGAAVAAAALVLAVGCKSSGTAGGNGNSGTGTPDIAIVFDKGGVDDQSFNASADRGRRRAEKELHVTTKYVVSRADLDYVPNLEDLAKLGCKLVFAVGGAMQDAVVEASQKYPNVTFAIIDGESKGRPNVVGVRFREEEGSFLAGIVAGKMTKTNTIGFVGGMKIPLIAKFEYGFRAGVYSVNPKANVIAKYTENWDDTAKGKEAALACQAGGADVVYHAAGKCGLGVFDAAKDKNFYAIGVDSDQDHVVPGRILTSMVKSVDEEVYQTAKLFKEGKLKGGDVHVGLKENAVGLSPMKYTKDLIGPATLKLVDDYRQKIVSGELVVPSTPEEFERFKAGAGK